MRKEKADTFRLERHGDVWVIIPAREVESLQWELVEPAATLIMQPLAKAESPLVIVDLSQVEFFGSVFLSLMVRFWKLVATKGGTMVMCGASERAQELLHVTALDTLWAIYDTRQEAMEVLESE